MAMVYRDIMCRQLGEMMEGVESMVRGTVPGFGAGGVGDRLMPAVRGEIRVDICEDDYEVRVVADLPGVERESITACLVSPTRLEISSERRPERVETGVDAQTVRRERTSGYMKRMVTLPHEVTSEGAKASFTNGVLEIRLDKCEVQRGERIPIE
jgi:HSP20 family protein